MAAPCSGLQDRGVRKIENRLRFGFKNRTIQKFDIVQAVSNRNCVQFAIQIKLTKITTCIQCADKEHFKILPDDTQCNCYSLLTTVSKSGMHNELNCIFFLQIEPNQTHGEPNPSFFFRTEIKNMFHTSLVQGEVCYVWHTGRHL